MLATLLSQAQNKSLTVLNVPAGSEAELVLPTLDNEQLLRDEMARRGPGIAPRFAYTYEVEINPATHGTWEAHGPNQQVWRYTISSEGAYSLNLGFSHFYLPEDGELRIYAKNKEEALGPFTPADHEDHNELWTPVIEGDELTVEIVIPNGTQHGMLIRLTHINHDFLGFAQALSGSCNLDVICGAADGWGLNDSYRDVIRSVGVYGLGGGTFCTGFLVNNTASDCRPFFMTANHCGLDAGNAPSLVVYWNFENSSCRQPGSSQSGQSGDGLLNQFNTGAIFRASYSPSDMALVELDDEINPDFKPFLAGWDASGVAPGDSVVSIHHPNTDEKRISFEFDATYIANSGGSASAQGNFVGIADWDIGTTEGGSSGSPLFDKNRRVIGQLLGGQAACGNNLYDVYGWFHRSWTGGGTPTTRLSDWLDPINSGQLTIDGKDCSIGVTASQVTQATCRPLNAEWDLTALSTFNGNVNLSVIGLPIGVQYSFTQNPIAPGSSSSLVVPTTGMPAGAYDFLVRGSDGSDSADLYLTLVVAGQIPTSIAPLNPTNGQLGMALIPTLDWDEEAYATYDVQLASDSLFANLIEEVTATSDGSWQPATVLTEETDYYWRIRGSNACGTGDWTSAYHFRTGAFFCQDNVATGLPITISDGAPNTISSNLNITDIGAVGQVKVTGVDITHSWIDDLTLTLTSPQGTQITLMGDLDCSDENALITFDDQGQAYSVLQNTCNASSPAISGTFAPADPLATFIGEDMQGTWTLSVDDGAFQDGGSLNGWGLEICGMQDAALQVGVSEVAVCPGDELLLPITLGNSFGEGSVVTMAVNGLPNGVNASFDPAVNTGNGSTVLTLDGWSGSGTHQVTILASSSSLTTTHPMSVTINGLLEPTLITPVDQDLNVVIDPVLSWSPRNADSVRVEVSSDPGFGTLSAFTVLGADSTWMSDSLDHLTDYYWRVISWNDCGMDTSSVYKFTTIWSTGLDLKPLSDIRLFPNPTQSQVQLERRENLDEELSMTLYNSSGQVLTQQVWERGNDHLTLDLSDYPDGIYLIQLLGDDSLWTSRVRKQ